MNNEIASHGKVLTPQELERIDKHCNTSATKLPLFVVRMASELAR